MNPHYALNFNNAGLNFVRQPIFPVVYKGQSIGEYRLDPIVENLVVIEIKSVERFDPIFEAQGPNLSKGHTQESRITDEFQFGAAPRWYKRFVLD
jgi:GxxExxY protein